MKVGRSSLGLEQLVGPFGAEKTGPRGGTELRGFADVLVDFHLFTQNKFEDRRRVLKVRGRLLPTVCKLSIELNEAGNDYHVRDGDLASGTMTLWGTLKTLVPEGPPGLSAQQFSQHWPSQPAPEARRLMEALKKNWQVAGWHRIGKGTKSDPYRYWRQNPENN